MYIDSHAHIYLKDFKDDLDEVVKSGLHNQITHTYMPNIDSSTIKALHSVEDKYENCHSMMGLHPCYVKENYKSELAIVEEWLTKRKYAAVGEIGIDLYWDKTFVKEQLEAYRYQINLAKDAGLAFVIHSRDSLEETIKEVESIQDGTLKGIFHCFNGTVTQGKRIIDAGFYLGIGGVITFKNAGVDKTVKELPLDKMVLETDSPYLTPTPHRGKRNEIAYIALIAKKLASIMERSTEEVATVTTNNCDLIFE